MSRARHDDPQDHIHPMLMLLITDCRRKPGQYVWSGCDPERQRACRIQARTPFSKRTLLHGGMNIGGKKNCGPVS